MTEPIVYRNGHLLPASQGGFSPADLGIAAGATVSEMLRTFGQVPYLVGEHLDRLEHSLALVRFPIVFPRAALVRAVAEVTAHNRRLIPPDDELGISVFITAGFNAALVGIDLAQSAGPTVYVHTYRLPIETWAAKFERGQSLVVPATHAIPADVLDPSIKSRSRLHWYVADRQARDVDPHAQALVLDGNGHVTETSTGNICLFSGDTVRTPPIALTLPGISLGVVRRLAADLGWKWEEAPLTPADVLASEECWMTSTPVCALPVCRLDGRPIGTGLPAPAYDRLMTAWNQKVGVDIREQVRTAAARGRPSPDPLHVFFPA